MREDRELLAPQPLAAEHDLSTFDCGHEALNAWLRQRARANQVTGATRTFVVYRGQSVVGYSALAAGAIATVEAPGRYRRNMPDPVPAMVLARLAIDLREQGRGIGAALLKDAVLRARRARLEHGIAVMLVHAIDESAKAFYLKFGFRPALNNGLTLLARFEDIDAAMNQDKA